MQSAISNIICNIRFMYVYAYIVKRNNCYDSTKMFILKFYLTLDIKVIWTFNQNQK